MKKNVASQVIGAQLVSATDGSAFTGSVTCYVTGDGGTQAVGSVGSGACTHEGNGFHTYAPAQAETNYDHVAFTFFGSGAIPVTVQLYTESPLLGAFIEGTVSDAGAAAGDFDAASGLSTANDFYNGMLLVFTSGNLQGVAREISDYVGSTTRNFAFTGSGTDADAPFPAAPDNGSTFMIISRVGT